MVLPDPVTVVVAGQQQFTATAYDSFGNEITGVGFDWSTDVGTIDISGSLTAQNTPTNGIVTATNGTVSGTVPVEVSVGSVDHITITPDTLIIAVGETQQFTAIAYDALNNVIPDPMFFWTSTAGVVNSTGFFSAQTIPGAGVVNVTSGSVTVTADITVLVGPIDHIIISPPSLTMVVGASQSFTAEAFDIYDNSISGVGFIWSTDVGSVDSSGFFTAQTMPGSGVVSATNSSVTGSASITIIPGVIDHLTVTPDPVTVVAAKMKQFTATAYDIYGNEITGIVFTWSTDIGSVDQNGLFTAQTMVDTGTVQAANGSITGSASVTLIPGSVDHIILTPDPITVKVGEMQQFTASGYDQYNNSIMGMAFNWNTNAGSIDANGLFTAQVTPTTGMVEATNGSVTGNASVIVILGDIDHIVVMPDPASVKIGETQQFTATAYDIFNNVIPGISFFWSTGLGVVNSTGFFTAFTKSGTGQIGRAHV